MNLRLSLWISTLEGALAELVAACGAGAVTTAWALHLGMSPFVVGLLGALAAAGGAATGIASAMAGALLPPALTLFGRPLAALQGLFVVGGAARLIAALLGLRVAEPEMD